MTDSLPHYAVMGNPIAHSLSPEIHQYFAKHTGQALHYEKRLVEALAPAVNTFFKQGGQGLNITVPFKEQAYQMATLCRPRAEHAQAANTLWLDEKGQLCADNTDGLGLVSAIKAHHTLHLQRILLIGAGGAARGVIQSLLDENPATLTIMNRDAQKADTLARHFGIKTQPMSEPIDEVDVIINATPTSLSNQLPRLNCQGLKSDTLVYDMVYQAHPTAFMLWGKKMGAGFREDGLGMLIEQAAEAFRIWRGVAPSSEIKKALFHHLRAIIKHLA